MTMEPQDIQARIEGISRYHAASKYTYESVRQTGWELGREYEPSIYRTFDSAPRLALPTTLMDAPVDTMALLGRGLEALPESQLRPPQDLKTLATWLYLGGGLTHRVKVKGRFAWRRSYPSQGACYPVEIYVAAFSIEGLEPGLYHFLPRTFALHYLRGGQETLHQLRRGRPDLEYLKTVPAALLVSTIFWRSAWRFRERGYRYALEDAGHVTANLLAAGAGLGMKTVGRLRMNENSMRQLIGIPPDAAMDQAEAVQTMVVWSDEAKNPLEMPSASSGQTSNEFLPIPRAALSQQVMDLPEVISVHRDCVAPAGAREIRPPLADISPIPLGLDTLRLETVAGEDEAAEAGLALRQVIQERHSVRDFHRRPLPRAAFSRVNRVAFRGGSYFPMRPEGPHVALVRPFWVINDVVGMDSGLWYYHPPGDQWTLLRPGDFRLEAAYLTVEQPMAGNASALCFMLADLRTLLEKGGPDTYRLAHLEAGIVGQRLTLAAASLGWGTCGVGPFYDDEVLKFLDMENSGWEAIYGMVIGMPAEEPLADDFGMRI